MAFNFIIPGVGCTISYSTTSGGSYTAVTQVQDIGGTSLETTMFDSTGISSDYGEQVPTMVKMGDVSINVFYDPANTTHVALHGYQTAKTLLYWKIAFPSPVGPGATAPGSAKTYGWAGYVKGFATSGFDNANGIIGAITIGPTGGPTLA